MTSPNTPGANPRWVRWLGRDPVLWALGLWSAVALLLLILTAVRPHRQAQVLWLAQPPLDFALAWYSWRVRALTGGPARRLWRAIAVMAALFLTGDTIQAVQDLIDPARATAEAGLVQSAFLAIGQVVVTAAMLTHPGAERGGRVRLALWLDSVTVLAGGVVVALCCALGSSGVLDPAQLTAGGVASVAAFAAVKMVLSGHAPMHRLAALPMVSAAVLLGICLLATPVTPGPSTLLLALQLLSSPLIAAGPRIQQLLIRHAREPFGSGRRKSYSLAPYGAVTAVLAVLVTTVPGGMAARLWIAVAGAIVVVALVVARQLVAFSDNAALIGRLDQTLGELRRHEARLRDQALYDGLTKLANRSHFHDELDQAIVAGPVSLLLVDLDHFKTINDTMGHAVGDELLVQVAARLRAAVRGTDLIARLGGDEFAVLLPHTDPAEADTVAERILAELARPVPLLHNDTVVQCSIGVASSGAGTTRAELMSDADIAMYAAKERGRATWVHYTPELGSRIRRTADLAARMQDALATDQFRLVFQPVVDLRTGGLVGAETLLRWDAGDELGAISPAEFIPIAEESGLIVPLGRRVLREACRQLAEWRRQYPAAAAIRVGVNVAGRQLREPGFAAEVGRALGDAGLAGGCLTIEVTETAVFDDEAAIDTLHELRALGVMLALDDFGTAASSLGLLLTCPVTVLKLDRSFVTEVTSAERPRAVASAVSQIAATLEFGSVAEGIETVEQAEVLRGLGYQFGQGYLYSRPVPAAEYAARWLADPAAAGRPVHPASTSGQRSGSGGNLSHARSMTTD